MIAFILILLFANLALTLSLTIYAMNTCATMREQQKWIDEQDKAINELLAINLINRGVA